MIGNVYNINFFWFYLNSAICPAHSNYLECGPNCEVKCNEPPPACLAKCVVGCFCDPGYIRTSEGACVLPAECPAIQRKNVLKKMMRLF